MILRDLTLHDFAVRFADEIQEWKRIRDQWQAKLIEAFHAVENGAADPFASDDPHWPVPDYIRRDFAKYCKRGTYVIHPETGKVWDIDEDCYVIDVFIADNYDPAILTTDCLLQQYYNYYDRRDLLIKAIDLILHDLTKDFRGYLKEYCGVDTDNPMIADQVLNFVICSVTTEALLTYLEDDFVVPDLFEGWAEEFTQDPQN